MFTVNIMQTGFWLDGVFHRKPAGCTLSEFIAAKFINTFSCPEVLDIAIDCSLSRRLDLWDTRLVCTNLRKYFSEGLERPDLGGLGY